MAEGDTPTDAVLGVHESCIRNAAAPRCKTAIERAMPRPRFQKLEKFQKRNATSCDVRDVVVRVARVRHRSLLLRSEEPLKMPQRTSDVAD